MVAALSFGRALAVGIGNRHSGGERADAVDQAAAAATGSTQVLIKINSLHYYLIDLLLFMNIVSH